MPIIFDKPARRYRDAKTGKFVTRESVRETINRTGDGFRQKAGKLATRLSDGKISKVKWQREMRQLIKENIIGTASIGKGGRLQMTFADWGRAGSAIKREYRYLAGFAKATSRLSPLQITARARQYANAGHVAFSQTLMKSQSEVFTEAKRSLHAKETCDGCRPLAGRWMPVEDMPDIGDVAPCYSRCRCSVEFR